MLRRALLTGLMGQMTIAPPRARAAGVEAVASFSVLADIARRIGDGQVELVSLVPRNGDPPAWQPTASDSRLLNQASLLIENGLGLEGWIARLSAASGFRG